MLASVHEVPTRQKPLRWLPPAFPSFLAMKDERIRQFGASILLKHHTVNMAAPLHTTEGLGVDGASPNPDVNRVSEQLTSGTLCGLGFRSVLDLVSAR